MNMCPWWLARDDVVCCRYKNDDNDVKNARAMMEKARNRRALLKFTTVFCQNRNDDNVADATDEIDENVRPVDSYVVHILIIIRYKCYTRRKSIYSKVCVKLHTFALGQNLSQGVIAFTHER